MSVDLEDYYCDLPFNEWGNYEERIKKITRKILTSFEKYNVKATFFTLGYIAEKHPSLIEKIVSNGHEIASHGYSHTDIRKMSKSEFESDLKKSLSILQKISGDNILGFRAPFFSINRKNSWVFDILKKYFVYDSSIFPVKTPLYGLPSAPRNIYHPSENDITKEDQQEKFIEIPPLTLRLANYNLPIAGGFYFRFFPNFLIKAGIKKFNKNNYPAMFYIHPKDLDDKMPKIDSYSWHYYYGKNNIKEKFSDLLQSFNFTTAKDVLNL